MGALLLTTTSAAIFNITANFYHFQLECILERLFVSHVKITKQHLECEIVP